MKETFQGNLDVRLCWDHDAQHELTFAENSKGNVFVQLMGNVQELFVELIAEAGSEIHVWLDVRTECSLKDVFRIYAHRDAQIHVSILDIEPIVCDHTIYGEHLGTGAQIEVHTATLATIDKRWEMELLHRYPHTSGIMENYCVVEQEAHCEVKAIGNIKKGAHDSVSHQTTRVLTMGEKHDAQVTPILYIDENAVKASHAMTLGQPDSEQLYYLQTRGLNKEMALGLLSIGYFLPIVEQIANSELREEIKCRVEEKVGLYGRYEHS